MKEKKLNANYFTKNGGIAPSTVSQVLHNGQKKIMLDLVYQFASTMDMSLKEFFDDPIFNEVTDWTTFKTYNILYSVTVHIAQTTNIEFTVFTLAFTNPFQTTILKAMMWRSNTEQ